MSTETLHPTNRLTFDPPYRCLLKQTKPLELILIGCGGTGSHLAQSIGSLLYHMRTQADIAITATFIDGDFVERGNVGRQRFCSAEIGQNKATTLAWRLNAAYGLTIRAIPAFVTVERLRQWFDSHPGKDSRLVIGCVDNASARQALATSITQAKGKSWWLDCGNAAFSGQVLIGNHGDESPIQPPPLDVGLWSKLPAPHRQEPGLLDPANDAAPTHTCTVAVATEEQSLMVNQFAASIAAQYLYQWTVQRELLSMGSYFNASPPLIRSVPITDRNLRPYFDT